MGQTRVDPGHRIARVNRIQAKVGDKRPYIRHDKHPQKTPQPSIFSFIGDILQKVKGFFARFRRGGTTGHQRYDKGRHFRSINRGPSRPFGHCKLKHGTRQMRKNGLIRGRLNGGRMVLKDSLRLNQKKVDVAVRRDKENARLYARAVQGAKDSGISLKEYIKRARDYAEAVARAEAVDNQAK